MYVQPSSLLQRHVHSTLTHRLTLETFAALLGPPSNLSRLVAFRMKRFPKRVPPSERVSSFPTVINVDGGFKTTTFKQLLRLAQWKAYLLIVGLILGVSVGFAGVYWKFGAFTLDDMALHDDKDKLFHMFMFSLAMTTTYDNSHLLPADTTTLLLANAQAFIVQLLLVFITGIVYILLTTPVPALTAADYVIIDEKRGVLETRFVFKDAATQIVDARITLTFRRNTVVDGVQLYKFDDLELRRESCTNLRGMCFVSHALDVDSPLHGMTLKELQAARAGFDLTVFGNELATMEPIFEQFTYEVHYGDVLYGDYMFHDLLYSVKGKTNRVLDHSRLNTFVGYHHVEESGDFRGYPNTSWNLHGCRGVAALLLLALSIFIVYLVVDDYVVPV